MPPITGNRLSYGPRFINKKLTQVNYMQSFQVAFTYRADASCCKSSLRNFNASLTKIYTA